MNLEIKRYNLIKGEARAKFDPETHDARAIVECLGVEETPYGDYVKYSDHVDIVSELQNMNPVNILLRIEEALRDL